MSMSHLYVFVGCLKFNMEYKIIDKKDQLGLRLVQTPQGLRDVQEDYANISSKGLCLWKWSRQGEVPRSCDLQVSSKPGDSPRVWTFQFSHGAKD